MNFEYKNGKILDDIKLNFNDVLIVPKRGDIKSRKEVSLKKTFTFKHTDRKWTGIPIIAANMDTIGTFDMLKEFAKKDMLVALHKHIVFTDNNNNNNNNNDNEEKSISLEKSYKNAIISCGIGKNDIKRLAENYNYLKDSGWTNNMICIDVANGYSSHFLKVIGIIRDSIPHSVIIAGNVVTPIMARDVILAGADIVKIGIGPGSVCTTRKKTGIGYPQFSAIMECADEVHKVGGLLISDGGCVCPGDIAKALGAGADFVMLGGMLSGHDESAGEMIEKNGKKYKLFYGMSSTKAMEKYTGEVAEYRSSEGKAVEVPYKGRVIDTINDILGGLRSACSYVGVKELSDFYDNVRFIKVREQLNNVYYNLKDVSKLR